MLQRSVALLLVSVLPLLVGAVELKLGYPVRLAMGDEKALCKVSFTVPPGTAAVRVLADFSDVTLGTQSAVLYAAPGDDVQRTAEARITAPQFGDTSVTIPNPTPGKWTLGVLANCNLCIEAIGNKAKPLVSVTPYLSTGSPLVPLAENQRTSLVSVVQGQMGFFTFTVPSRSTVYFNIDRSLKSVGDSLQAYLKKDGFPAEGELNNPAKVTQLALTMSLEGQVELDAGKWTLGVKAGEAIDVPLEGKISRTEFDVAFAIGGSPVVGDLEPLDICPDEPAPAETGDWNKCADLPCQACVEEEGCGFCRVDAPGKFDITDCQRLDASNQCKGAFEGLPDVLVTDAAQCPRCAAYSCEQCIEQPDCSWCAAQVAGAGFNATTAGCENGVACKFFAFGIGITPLADASQCGNPASLVNLTYVSDAAGNALDKVRDRYQQAVGDGNSGKADGKGFGGPNVAGDGFTVDDDGKIVLPGECGDFAAVCKEECAERGGVRRCDCGSDGNVQSTCKDGATVTTSGNGTEIVTTGASALSAAACTLALAGHALL